MKFQIEGASRETGDEINMTVDAATAEEACEKVSRMGILVAECHAPTRTATSLKTQANRLAGQGLLHARRLLKTRAGRIGAAVTAAVLIMLGVVLVIAHHENEKMRLAHEEAIARTDRMHQKRMADLDKGVGDAQYNAYRARVLGEVATGVSGGNDPAVAEPKPSKTKGEAIDANPVITAFLEDYPDMRWQIERGGTGLTAKLQLLMSAGKLTAGDVRYISRFADSSQTLPNY